MHEEQQLCTASCHGASHKVKPCPKEGLHESRAVTLAPPCHDVSLLTSVCGYWCEVCFLLSAVAAQHKSVELILTRAPSSEGA